MKLPKIASLVHFFFGEIWLQHWCFLGNFSESLGTEFSEQQGDTSESLPIKAAKYYCICTCGTRVVDNDYEHSKSYAVDINKSSQLCCSSNHRGSCSHLFCLPASLNIPKKIRNVSCFHICSVYQLLWRFRRRSVMLPVFTFVLFTDFSEYSEEGP